MRVILFCDIFKEEIHSLDFSHKVGTVEGRQEGSDCIRKISDAPFFESDGGVVTLIHGTT